MRYKLEIKPEVSDYLRGLQLTREGRIRLHTALNEAAEFADLFRNDPSNRAGPFFSLQNIFNDAGRLRMLFLVVDDSPAAYGVLSVVYAELY
jgi:hypothetical protein